jgi:hypothetical protein
MILKEGDGHFEKQSVSEIGAAQVIAVSAKDDFMDADLKEIARRWHELPASMKTGIIAMVRAVEDTK